MEVILIVMVGFAAYTILDNIFGLNWGWTAYTSIRRSIMKQLKESLEEGKPFSIALAMRQSCDTYSYPAHMPWLLMARCSLKILREGDVRDNLIALENAVFPFEILHSNFIMQHGNGDQNYLAMKNFNEMTRRYKLHRRLAEISDPQLKELIDKREKDIWNEESLFGAFINQEYTFDEDIDDEDIDDEDIDDEDIDDPEAQAKLGDMYSYGEGVKQDDQQALKWYRKAAEQGDAHAQNMLGTMYFLGHGVEKDNQQALKWFRKAAEQGNADAQSSLGAVYLEGKGVPQDGVLAYMWFNIAEAMGDSEAPELRDMLAEAITPAQRQEAQKMAREWIAKH